jgi:hypothetical protein
MQSRQAIPMISDPKRGRGYAVFFGPNLIAWSALKQVANATAELIWV